MKSLQEIAGISRWEFCEYNVKCFVGVAIGYLCYKAFPQQSGLYLWMLISILLAITHDNNSRVAYDRMKSNILGSTVGLLTFLLHDPPNLLTICVGVALTIAICFRLGLISVARTALVAYIIVVLYEEAHSSWEGAVYRMASVVGGCAIGLAINYVFRRVSLALSRPIATSSGEQQGSGEQHDSGE